MSTAVEPVGVAVDLPDGLATLPDAIRRRELAAFLRSRRERLTPSQVGLPITGRRRTPGLRREEVAQLAGARDGRAGDGPEVEGPCQAAAPGIRGLRGAVDPARRDRATQLDQAVRAPRRRAAAVPDHLPLAHPRPRDPPRELHPGRRGDGRQARRAPPLTRGGGERDSEIATLTHLDPL